MNKKSISAVLFLVAFLSCRKAEGYRIPSTKLKEVIRDMYLVDLNVSAHPKDYRDSIAEVYMNQISRIHDVTKADIEHDLELLQSDFDLLDSIYSEIIRDADERLRIKGKSIAPSTPTEAQ